MNFSLKKLFFGLMLAGMTFTLQTAEKKAQKKLKPSLSAQTQAKIAGAKKWFTKKFGSSISYEDERSFKSPDEHDTTFESALGLAKAPAVFLYKQFSAELCRLILDYAGSQKTIKKHINIPLHIARWNVEEHIIFTKKPLTDQMRAADLPVAKLWWSEMGYNQKYEQLNVQLCNMHSGNRVCTMSFKVSKDNTPVQKLSAFPFGVHSSLMDDREYQGRDEFVGDTTIDLPVEPAKANIASSSAWDFHAKVTDYKRSEIEIICYDFRLVRAIEHHIRSLQATKDTAEHNKKN